ncbi:MAG: ROK family protein [Polyangiaceae bacterium]|nr:ROK family protein [Polyangiaceae bacterium]
MTHDAASTYDPSRSRIILAFDCGGTILKAAAVDLQHGQCGDVEQRPTNRDATPDELVRTLTEMIATVCARNGPETWHRVIGIGVAMPGPSAYEDGVSYAKHRFPNLVGEHLKSRLARSLADCAREQTKEGIQAKHVEQCIFFLNDAMAFAIGARALLRQPGERVERFVGITLGTGLGASFLVNGIPASPTQNAPDTGEIWEFRYRNGTLETYVSASAIETDYRELASASAPARPALGPGEPFSPPATGDSTPVGSLDVDRIAALADESCEAATKAFARFGESLAEALRLTVFAFKPNLVAIGGPIARHHRHFVAPFRDRLGRDWNEHVHVCTDEEVASAPIRGIADYVAARLVPSELLVVPNEDGLGPSSLCFYVVREMLERQRLRRGGIGPGSIVVRNETRATYNEAVYRSAIDRGCLRVERIHGIIQLGKKSGRLGFEESLTNLLNYERLCRMYASIPLGRDERRCVGVLDIGTPAATGAAWMRAVPRATLFDHMWSTTFEKIVAEYVGDHTFSEGTKQPSARVRQAIEAIRGDERKTNVVFLFPSFLTPEDYRLAWRDTPAAVVEIGGVLGGNPPTTSALVDRLLVLLDREREPSIHDSDLPATLVDNLAADVKKLGGLFELPRLGGLVEGLEEHLIPAGADASLDVQLFQRALDQLVQNGAGRPGPAGSSTALSPKHDQISAPDSRPLSDSPMAIAQQPGEAHAANEWKRAILEARKQAVGRPRTWDLVRTSLTNRVVRYALDLESLDPIVYVSGGGTAVWTPAMFDRIVTDSLLLEGRNELEFNLVVCAPDDTFKNFGLGSNKAERDNTKERNRLRSLGVDYWIPKDRNSRSAKRIRFLRNVTDGTHQEVFLGVDLIVSRAGGGTANDAIACRVPMCCVEEPNLRDPLILRPPVQDLGERRSG